MERLTRRCNGVVVYVGSERQNDTGDIPCEVSTQGVREILVRLAEYEDGTCDQKKVWERLKSYEDRGCEPEEVLPKDKADEIALKLMRLADLESLCNYTRLRELAEADKDGRLVVQPCKVGDTVYIIEHIFDIDNGVCDEICARKIIGHGGNNLNKLWLIGSGGIGNISIFVSEFGKTVFLTREEAERAMQKMEGKT